LVIRKKGKKKKGKNMANAEHERLFSIVFDTGLQLHKELGPGLMESVYETVLACRLERTGLKIDRQKPVSIIVDGITFPDAYRVDLLVSDLLVVELKSLEKLTSLHIRQALTYVRLLNQPLGILMNFGGETLAEGTRRIMNNQFGKT
jgi:iron complex transport system substrate-binding protein